MERSRSTLALVVLCSCSCRTPTQPVAEAPTQTPNEAPAPTPKPEPEPFEWQHTFVADERAGTFAVVDQDTVLRKRPSLDDPGWRFDGYHESVVKVLGRDGEFLEVALDWPANPEVFHCALAPMARLGLTMFVREDELADVTTASIMIETGEDMGVIAAPGTVVVEPHPSASSARRALQAKLHELSPYGGSTGSYFRVWAPTPIPEVGKLYSPTRVDSERERISATGLTASTAYEVDHGSGVVRMPGTSAVYGQSPSDPTTMLVGARCLQVAGKVHKTTSEGGGGGGCGAEGFEWSEHWIVPAETALFWRSGGEAGRLVRELELWVAPRRRGKSSCFEPRLTCAGASYLEVCVDKDVVQHVPASEPPAWWTPMLVPERAG